MTWWITVETAIESVQLYTDHHLSEGQVVALTMAAMERATDDDEPIIIKIGMD